MQRFASPRSLERAHRRSSPRRTDDRPSPRDTKALREPPRACRRGSTVLVEHDAETIRAADYVSIRPGGEKRNGGHIMAEARGAGAGPAKSPPRALAESAG